MHELNRFVKQTFILRVKNIRVLVAFPLKLKFSE